MFAGTEVLGAGGILAVLLPVGTLLRDHGLEIEALGAAALILNVWFLGRRLVALGGAHA